MGRHPHRVLHSALALVPPQDPTPRLNQLYSDARRVWLAQPFADAPLHQLVLQLLRRQEEVTPEEETSIRAQYGLLVIA